MTCWPLVSTWLPTRCFVRSVLLIFMVFCVCLYPVSCVPNVSMALDCPFLIAPWFSSNVYSNKIFKKTHTVRTVQKFTCKMVEMYTIAIPHNPHANVFFKYYSLLLQSRCLSILNWIVFSFKQYFLLSHYTYNILQIYLAVVTYWHYTYNILQIYLAVVTYWHYKNIVIQCTYTFSSYPWVTIFLQSRELN